MRVRLALGATGVAVCCWGAWLLLDQARATRPVELLTWGVALVIAHDFVLAPAAAAVGVLLLGRSLRRSGARRNATAARRWLAAALFVGTCLTLVAAPLLLVPGRAPDPSSRPLDYARNLLLVIGTVLATAGLGIVATLPAVRRTLHRFKGRPTDA